MGAIDMVSPTDNNSPPSWTEIVDSFLSSNQIDPRSGVAQKAMLVPYLRQRGMAHNQARLAAGVSDKNGKNAFRVAETADPTVTDLIRSGRTSVNDAMMVIDLPVEIQQAAVDEVRAGEATKLQSSAAVVDYMELHPQLLSQILPSYEIDDILDDGCFLDQPKLETMLQRLQTKQNLILQGPPGTGKTWLAKKLAYALIGYKDDSKVRPLQFHPNLSYEDFVRGWRPQGDGKIALVDGPFLQLIADAEENPDDEYVMVIEEINRGNPAQIFGEMLTLLEADKRNEGGALALAYPRKPGERVHIPPNVYVIGTMNVADRSLALVDLALRRRFAFFDLEPVFGSVWRNWMQEQFGIDVNFLSDVEHRMTSLNEQIADDRSLGPQFRIGHSYVTPAPSVAIADPVEWFIQVVETEIGPLLDEYWFDSLERAAAAESELLDGL